MRRPDTFQRIREGVVGEFVPVVDPPLERWLSGALRLDDSEATATLIADEKAFDSDGLPVDCTMLAGRTEVGDVLLAAVRSRGSSRGALNIATYRTKYLLVDVEFDQVDDDTVVALQMAYHGLIKWVDSKLYRESAIVEDGEHVGWNAELRYGKGATIDLGEGFTLRLSPGWQIGGPSDRRTFATPLTVTVESRGRQPIGDHIVRLDAVHALLNIAHGGQVTSFGGSAKLANPRHWCGFWDTDLMDPTAADQGMREFPYLGLEHVGGVQGVAKWVDLVLKHRRAVVPLVRHTLFANQTAESRLLSTASAMETWVAAHRRNSAWAAKVKDENLPGALIRKVDRSWDAWVGDSDRWLDMFWDAYNSLKHRPDVDLDPRQVHMLEISGRWLLTGALLDDCAGSTAPSHHLFGKSLMAIGGGVREVLDEFAGQHI